MGRMGSCGSSHCHSQSEMPPGGGGGSNACLMCGLAMQEVAGDDSSCDIQNSPVYTRRVAFPSNIAYALADRFPSNSVVRRQRALRRA
jgi:hypothetical protein